MFSFRLKRSPNGFTLIEILVVVAIVAILVGILMPSLMSARSQARRVMCSRQLQQIGVGTLTYVNSFGDLLPDPFLLGRHAFRQAPRTKTPRDPVALPERYGLAAALGHPAARAIPGDSSVWVCPEAADWMVQGKNSYAFSFSHPAYNLTSSGAKGQNWNRKYSTLMSGRGSVRLDEYIWTWDNYSFRYGLTGFFGPWTGYTIPEAQRVYPHAEANGRFFTRKHRSINALYLDLHVASRRFE